MIPRTFGLIVTATVALGSGCSLEEVAPASICVDYEDPERYAPEASFELDVMPIFAHACNFNACHGLGTENPQEGLVLGRFEGETTSDTERTAVIAGIVGVGARLAAMDQVVAGDPANSFLLAKLEYTDFVACDTNRCVGLRCGGRMPRADPAFSEEELKPIRTWIRDGARDN